MLTDAQITDQYQIIIIEKIVLHVEVNSFKHSVWLFGVGLTIK